MKVHDARDGTYRLSTVAGMAGRYTITAMVNGKAIEGTPIEIPAITGLIKVLGKNGTQKGELLWPLGVSINRDGDIVTADSGNDRLQVFDTDGNCKKVIEYIHFKKPFHPTDVVVSEENHLYYSLDEGNRQVVVSDMDGNLIDCFGQGKLSYPVYIAIHPLNGDVYIVDRCVLFQKIKVFPKNGSYVRSFSLKDILSIISSIAISRTGMIFAVNKNTTEGYIQMFHSHGKYLGRFGSTSTEGDGERREKGIVVYDEYVYACNNNSIIKYDFHGVVLASIEIKERIKYPVSLAVGGESLKIVVVDRDNCCLKMFVE
ncbi:tripartite motif-containing protein 2-like [Ptychodera flava]|uniref:tripartite motif-containing protein 2-like n=1 Tax=Ptychodera flava TaxID=63121 RepID=UPI00396A3967